MAGPRTSTKRPPSDTANKHGGRAGLLFPASVALALVLCLSCTLTYAQGTSPAGLNRLAPGSGAAPNDTSNTVAVRISSPELLNSLIRSGLCQWVRFEGPPGSRIELPTNDNLVLAADLPVTVALVVGRPYRMRLLTVRADGKPVELYPSVRLLGYLSPPPDVEPASYPVPILFLAEDTEEVLKGRFAQNVVYLEDPAKAIPRSYEHGPPVTDLRPGEDPLAVASELGRPMALVLIGTRVPVGWPTDAAAVQPPLYLPGQTDLDRFIAAVLGSPPSQAAIHGRLPGWPFPLNVHPRMPADEYICDGGDDVPYVHFRGHGMVGGLEGGEATAQYRSGEEKPRLVTANRVCVYAPRFGLLRSHWGTAQTVQKRVPDKVRKIEGRRSLEAREGTHSRKRAVASMGMRLREPPVATVNTQMMTGLDQVRALAAQDYWQHAAQDIGAARSSMTAQAFEARLATSIDAARVWSRRDYPAYTALAQTGSEVASVSATGTVKHIKEPYRRPGKLEIFKTADKKTAKPGEVIEFAIWYKNVGEQPVEAVSIIDSLPARLEYVPGSAKTDRKAVFSTKQNEVGSLELRWDIIGSIGGGERGVVWFKARVR